ncbi:MULTISPECIES: 3-deoxy-manno-octulosonate cytidylyltransferase [unclassified Brevundimonas]|uniref:3-deoxy-manno-octulosonate cytidylyltransferase n=1 Tax=unclassified Brevundimonas TaxID=2622653 RepID=UPI000CFC59A1|nr:MULTISPECIES: 3-deoxy-manno-octulosonate cytidylyltransferase [unclassified Brevundimonas]PRA33251.1 3-deoxy-manno-octulosonate cytidylyltransferase [Brevundimonas sp. MYb27]PQZ83910.1 3-deoxy-manno-octulosonate cytidylyltransferase [Brevundimonas sp. MYb31]PRB13839.1 3-deoxy-manno-octulosonate cytidylyltransferase [Brevundimonas sp. MYb52]PRB34428.1 3-deoxy-manno-octulosonate cytidylyltransferase [Brevundimonas sp. MYb46]PRB53906.1 3-deoxy-manno-octulosonate cytidylyltransferase [Brevundim
MNPLIMIPARMAATRLPDKPLADIGGKPMIVRAWEQAARSGFRVAVAAGDPEIVEAVEAAGGLAVLTDPALPSGSDRIRAAVEAVDPDAAHDIVINIQGDMPFASPDLARACADLLARESGCDIATLVAAEADVSDRANPDVVKAVLALPEGETSGRALYFTRSTLYGDGPIWRHVGIYGYRRDALMRFCAAPPSPLEKREKLEQLRALEMGLQIWASVIAEAPLSVDNPADLEAARALA